MSRRDPAWVRFMEGFGKFAVVFTLVLAVIVGLTLYRGAVIELSWRWFIEPVFSGAPSLDLAESIGLSLVVGLLTFEFNDPDEDKEFVERLLELVVKGVVFYTLYLIFALILHGVAPVN